MKAKNRWLLVMSAVAGLVVGAGCNTVSTNSHIYLGTTTYPATEPAQVEILSQEPARPHVKLGEVQAQPAGNSVSNQKIEEALQQSAAKMGANAVVVTADRTEVVGATVTGPVWARTVNNISGRVITGVAIRYTDR